jgi:integrase
MVVGLSQSGESALPLNPLLRDEVTAVQRCLASHVDVRNHAFRRWHASRWLAAGGSETGLMANSGWTSSAMVGRYTRDAKEQNAQLEAERLFG